MREEILFGLKNAMERGDSLEKAVQSYINAGYNPMEIRAAANMLSEGTVTDIMQGQAQQAKSQVQQPKQNFQAAQMTSQEIRPSESKQPGKRANKWIIIAIIILLIICAVAGATFIILKYM